MIGAHQPGSQPIDIPEVIPNPAVVPKQEPAPKEPVRVPEKVPADRPRIDARQVETERHCRQRENALGDPAHRLTAAIALSGYRSPAAIPLGTARYYRSFFCWRLGSEIVSTAHGASTQPRKMPHWMVICPGVAIKPNGANWIWKSASETKAEFI
jgi:hypothetical protein